MGVIDCPLCRYGCVLFHDRVKVETAWKDNAPSGGNEFAFRGGLVPASRLSFWGHCYMEDFFFEEGFGKGEI